MYGKQILTEGLTKGSQRVLNDKKLVPELADAIRDDVQMNPGPFTNIGPVKQFQKLPDMQLASWFLENLDAIERAGYEGTIYSRDGANSEWIVRRYIAGSHNWEDLTGVMNMNLRNWYELKKEGVLDAEHRDIPKFKSVRDIGRYITIHYAAKLKEIQDKAALAFQAKLEKYIKLVDNDDYRIYTTLNWAANSRLGLGTQWCTANSKNDGNYRHYSSRAMLFQLFPYEKAEETAGKKKLIGKQFNIEGKPVESNEKYQFDAGGPSSFMDNLDNPVQPSSLISERFPYLYDDLVKALTSNKEKLETIFVELAQDRNLQNPKGLVRAYDIDEEIRKLSVFETRGYFTKKKRPAPKPVAEPAAPAAPQIAQVTQEPTQENIQTESLKELLDQFLNEDIDEAKSDKYFGPLDQIDQPEEPSDVGELRQIVISDIEDFIREAQEDGETPTDHVQYDSESSDNFEAILHSGDEDLKRAYGAVRRMSEEPAERFIKVAIQALKLLTDNQTTDGNIMENIDKDVAAMLGNLKKYDKLVESCAPVLMARPGGRLSNGIEESADWAEERRNDYRTPDSDGGEAPWRKEERFKAEREEAARKKYGNNAQVEEGSVEDYIANGGKVQTLPYMDGNKEKAGAGKTMASKHQGKGGQGTKGSVTGLGARKPMVNKQQAEPVSESATPDADVLAWMARFAKLGDMKGYGR